jgi:PIN domain nuclease of toxin-antitoxin system
MAGMIRLDTHLIVWLYAGDIERLSATAIDAIETHDLLVSPMVGRLSVGGSEIIGDLRDRIGLRQSDESMASVVHAAASVTWTRDPFDRMIVADAIVAATDLLTKDQTILANTSLARW